MNGWVYQTTEPGLLTVGYYDPTGRWHSDSDHTTREAAAARCNYLNGGTPREKGKQNDNALS
jgi:hypothetical protein